MTDPTREPSELLPCPFCGGDAKEVEFDDGYKVVECKYCQIQTAPYFSPFVSVEKWNTRASAPQAQGVPREPDYGDGAVEPINRFAAAMKEKMYRKYLEGYSGWQDLTADEIRAKLLKHVEKGDPVDVANFAMMLWHIDAAPPSAAEPCKHDWVSAVNEVVKNGYICSKCHALSAEPASAERDGLTLEQRDDILSAMREAAQNHEASALLDEAYDAGVAAAAKAFETMDPRFWYAAADRIRALLRGR